MRTETDVFLGVVLAYRERGFNPIPVRTDGSRVPLVKWKRYQTERLSETMLVRLILGEKAGVMMMCGQTSGNLEVIDHDAGKDVYHEWKKPVDAELPGFLDTLPVVKSPGKGYHVWYRTPELYSDPKHLARADDGKVLIELLGQGCMATPVTPRPYVHSSCKPHVLLHGDIMRPPVITPHERDVLLTAARSFNKYVCPPAVDVDVMRELYGDFLDTPSDRPGDEFDRTAEWADILEPHGWDCVRWGGRVRYWRKPMSRGPEHHATTDFYPGIFKVFSGSARPFEYLKSYTKFGVYALLNHGGDWSEAAKELTRRCPSGGPIERDVFH